MEAEVYDEPSQSDSKEISESVSKSEVENFNLTPALVQGGVIPRFGNVLVKDVGGIEVMDELSTECPNTGEGFSECIEEKNIGKSSSRKLTPNSALSSTIPVTPKLYDKGNFFPEEIQHHIPGKCSTFELMNDGMISSASSEFLGGNFTSFEDEGSDSDLCSVAELVPWMLAIPVKLKSLDSDNDEVSSYASDELFTCTVCNEAFSMWKDLKVHQMSHIFPCSFCQKVFSSQLRLKKHIMLHIGTDRKRFSCNKCPKAFATSRNLNKHKLLHTGEKLYSCSGCKKTFVSWSRLLQHRIVHITEKLYPCKICNKTFRTVYLLKRHFARHGGKKSYNYNICRKTLKHFHTSSV